jgi:HPt (histidine-containing phosphotransfer) domain-containing protein
MSDGEPPVLDESVLAELMETTGDAAFVRELIETYLADTPVQMDGIDKAVGADDADALVRPAHTLKSSSATMGAMRLAAVARELEMSGRSGALGASSQAGLETARAEWAAASAALHAWLAGNASQ